MKKTLIGILIGLVVGGLLIYQLAGPGFWHKAPAGERNSFYPVTDKLDAGGPFYLYASTESVIRAVGEFSAKIRAFIPANPETTQAVEIFDFIAGLIKKSGLAEISGVGISSIPIDAELRRMRLVIHHYRDQGKGILWQVMGEKPHGLEELKLLPADTVLASFSDFDIHALWQWFKSETEASKLAGLKKTIFSAESMLQKLGIPFEKILQSLSGGMGALVTLDAKKNMVIPIGGTTLTFPEPGLALLFAVKDDTLFNLIAQKIPFAQKTEEKGVKKLLIPLPPLPFPLKPAIVQRDGWLIVAAHEKLIEAMFAAREKKNGLLASSEFQKLAAGIPTKGNGFRFLSPRFSRTLANIQKVGLARILASRNRRPR